MYKRQKVFLEFDSAAMQAFMSGQIKAEGDMTKLMTLQTAALVLSKKHCLPKYWRSDTFRLHLESIFMLAVEASLDEMIGLRFFSKQAFNCHTWSILG